MDNLDELLPGIEDFLVKVLANESLSSTAEEQRQYFVERLDILKLPPSIPPRPGRKSVSDLVEDHGTQDGVAVSVVAEVEPAQVDVAAATTTTPEPEDFAAYQRELSRHLETIHHPTEHSDAESEQGVKVYDDIDTEEYLDGRESEEEDEQDLYEIPVARLQLSEDSNAAGSQSGDRASLATAASVDDITEEVADVAIPPPLPPRRDRAASELTAQSSVGLEDKPPDLPARHPPRDVYEKSNQSEKSDRSDDHMDGDYTFVEGGDSTSYESYDEDSQYHDVELLNKLNIKLPKRPKKKSNKLKKKLSKSRSSSNWELNVPFKKLEDMSLSGELQTKGKLSWTRKLVALSNGCMACYKADKETKPQFVIHLTGYEASMQKDNRKGYEVKLWHPNCDSYVFSVDFKEWAVLWTDHINHMATGLPPPGPYQHLARTSFSGNSEHGSKSDLSMDQSLHGRAATLDSTASLNSTSTVGSKVGSTVGGTLTRWDWKAIFYNWMFPIDHFIVGLRRPDLNVSNSNLSTSSDGLGLDDSKPKLRAGNKVMRMGSFAYRATQFFESLGKKSGKRKMAGLSVPPDNDLYTSDILEERSLSSESAPPNLTPLSDSNAPVFDDPESPGATNDVLENIKHEGYLNIFSSFNRRRWGKRWCLVRENMFECYRNEKAKQCELNFLLKTCMLRRAVEETNSELALMLLEDGKEKVTVEPLSKTEMGPWVQLLMAETSTDHLPDGLEEYFPDDNHSNNSFSDLLGYSVIQSWDLGRKFPSTSSLKVVNQEDIPEEEEEEEEMTDVNDNSKSMPSDSGSSVPADVYTKIEKKRGKSLTGENIPESPEGYDERKHTTDSGFYSVKGSNSDSESDSGCVLRSEEDSHCASSPGNLQSSETISEKSKSREVTPTSDQTSTENLSTHSNEPNGSGLASSALESGEVTLTDDEQRELTPALSPSLKKRTNGANTSDLHIRFSLDNENNNVRGGEYDEVEVIHSPTFQEETVDRLAEVDTIHSQNENSHGDDVVPDDPVSEDVFKDSEEENCVQSDDVVSDMIVNVTIDLNSEVIALSKCDMFNSSSEAETVKSSSASMVSLSDKLECHVSPVSSDSASFGEADEGTTADKDGVQDNVDTHVSENEENREITDNCSEERDCPEKTLIDNVPENNSTCLINNQETEVESESVAMETTESSDLKSSSSGEEFERDIQHRIGRLREKLVQIKRKRIAVRDKRLRVTSEKEQQICDDEYTNLDKECHEIDSEISTLEKQLTDSSSLTSS